MQPSQRFVRPFLCFRCSISSLHLDNLSFFDNLEFDIFDAGSSQCHFSRLYCMAGDFLMPTHTSVQDLLPAFLFLPLFHWN